MRRQHQVNTHRPRHLRQAGNGLFHVARVQHHQIGQFVNDDDDVGQRPLLRILAEQARSAVLLKEPVVLINISNALFGQKLQAPLHLAHRITQCIGGQLGLGDNRRI